MMPLDPATDRRLLTQQAYATDDHYAVRVRTHELYSQPKLDFVQWVIDRLAWRGDERVLDVGAGPGTYFAALRRAIPRGLLVGADLSLGMLHEARRTDAADDLLNLDVQDLPFADGSFDVALANHMLYHVPDVERALRELRRVLKPDGVLLAATNSAYTMPELETLARRACTLLGYPRQELHSHNGRFSLENGPLLLARAFRAVARYDCPSAFIFPSAAPVMDYIASTKPLQTAQLPAGLDWDEFMDVMETQIARLIRQLGELRVEKLAGVLAATNGGGFARDFLRALDSGGVE